MHPGTRPSRSAGQASIELIATLPFLILIGLLVLQLGLAGYTYTLVDGAAEAGAVALASGLPAEPQVRKALPAWSREGVTVRTDRGRVEVTVRPPGPIGAITDRLLLKSSAHVAVGR